MIPSPYGTPFLVPEHPRVHDSNASPARALRDSLPMIGRLRMHTRLEATARYAHPAEDSLYDVARLSHGEAVSETARRTPTTSQKSIHPFSTTSRPCHARPAACGIPPCTFSASRVASAPDRTQLSDEFLVQDVVALQPSPLAECI